ncbi:hypothetical protein HED60_13885 [Planctomycetales bacterium ZRK34]|nr:hypothetical protein HED60_13885 [Planctomycetales bacterium ZRK34]
MRLYQGIRKPKQEQVVVASGVHADNTQESEYLYESAISELKASPDNGVNRPVLAKAKLAPTTVHRLPIDGYNHSCCHLPDGDMLFASQAEWQPSNVVTFVRTDGNYDVRWKRPIRLDRDRCHDPRLFWAEGELRCVLPYRHAPKGFRLLLCTIDVSDNAIKVISPSTLPGLKYSEKNWIFYGDYIFYDFDAGIILDRQCRMAYAGDAHLGLGLRGGTNVLGMDEWLICICHSYYLHKSFRIYGAYLVWMDVQFPYRRRGIIEIEGESILRVVPKSNPTSWVVNNVGTVIFPMSFYDRDDCLEMVCGVNDSGSAVCMFSKREIRQLIAANS